MEYDYEQIAADIRAKRLEYIGSGSGRSVYALGNKTVVKAAKNIKGIRQNEAEAAIWGRSESPILAKVYDLSQDAIFLIMQRASGVSSMRAVWHYFHVRSNHDLFRLPELERVARDCGLILADFGRSVNWGKADGRMVIVDYGLTIPIKKKYY